MSLRLLAVVSLSACSATLPAPAAPAAHVYLGPASPAEIRARDAHLTAMPARYAALKTAAATKGDGLGVAFSGSSALDSPHFDRRPHPGDGTGLRVHWIGGSSMGLLGDDADARHPRCPVFAAEPRFSPWQPTWQH